MKHHVRDFILFLNKNSSTAIADTQSPQQKKIAALVSQLQLKLQNERVTRDTLGINQLIDEITRAYGVTLENQGDTEENYYDAAESHNNITENYYDAAENHDADNELSQVNKIISFLSTCITLENIDPNTGNNILHLCFQFGTPEQLQYFFEKTEPQAWQKLLQLDNNDHVKPIAKLALHPDAIAMIKTFITLGGNIDQSCNSPDQNQRCNLLYMAIKERNISFANHLIELGNLGIPNSKASINALILALETLHAEYIKTRKHQTSDISIEDVNNLIRQFKEAGTKLSHESTFLLFYNNIPIDTKYTYLFLREYAETFNEFGYDVPIAYSFEHATSGNLVAMRDFTEATLIPILVTAFATKLLNYTLLHPYSISDLVFFLQAVYYFIIAIILMTSIAVNTVLTSITHIKRVNHYLHDCLPTLFQPRQDGDSATPPAAHSPDNSPTR